MNYRKYWTANNHSWKIADNINMINQGSLSFYFLVCVSVHALYATVLMTQTKEAKERKTVTEPSP